MPDHAPEAVRLSEAAVASLRFRIKGFPLREQDLPAYRELVAAGIAEPAPAGARGRFTPWGMEHREAILERESERIERERYEPPDGELSDAARGLLRRIAAGRVEVDAANRPLFRELTTARVVILGGSFAGGPESGYRFTYWGWKLKDELTGRAKEAV